MTKLFATLAAFSLSSLLAIGAAAIPRKISADDLETRNLITVQSKLGLCARSGCSPCGTFRYNVLHEFVSSPTLCEMNFENTERVQREADEDREIRTKYGPADGGTDAGTDAGRLDGGLTRELPREDPAEVLS